MSGPCLDGASVAPSEPMTPTEARKIRTHRARTSYVERFAHLALIVLALYVFYLVGAWVAPVLAPVLLALLIAYCLDPLIDWFEERGARRTLVIVVLATMSLGALVQITLFVVPVVTEQLSLAIEELPTWIERHYASLRAWLSERFDMDIESRLVGSGALEAVAERSQRALSSVAASLFNSVATLLNLILIPVFTFYFLRDFDSLKRRPLELVPARYQEWVKEVAREMDDVVGAWMRGQIQVAMVLAVIYAVGLGLIGVELGVLIGVIAGVLNVVPYFGLAVGLGLSVLMVLIYGAPEQLVGVGLLFMAAQLLEDYVIKPRLVGEKVGMGPVMVMAVLLLGGSLFGFFGLLLSVPVVAALTVVC